MKIKTRFRAVVLAGGTGERFWPLSTPRRPKQFLELFGGESLMRQTVQRLSPLAGSEDVFVVTAREFVRATRRELPGLPRGHVVGEPFRRDTLAAVALGVGAAAADGDDPVVGFFPSDHLVARPAAFRKTVARAVSLARRNASIVVIGIRPTFPSTNYGYISPKSRRFVEKPDEATARRYIKAGCLWNAGMFIARASVFKAAIAARAGAAAVLASGRRAGDLEKIYGSLERISFDRAVMEHARNIEVVPGDFGWDDVGDFAALDRHFPHDAEGNVKDGDCVPVDAGGNICIARGARIFLLGVSNLVVVATPTAVLVAGKNRLGGMRRLVEKGSR